MEGRRKCDYVCVCVNSFLSTSEARDLNGDGASGASPGRKGSGAQDQWGQEGIQTRSAAFLWELLLSWRQS